MWAIGDVTLGNIAVHSRRGTFSLDLYAGDEEAVIHSSSRSLLNIELRMTNGMTPPGPYPLKYAPRLHNSADSYVCQVKELHFPKKVTIPNGLSSSILVSPSFDPLRPFSLLSLSHTFSLPLSFLQPTVSRRGDRIFAEQSHFRPPHGAIPMQRTSKDIRSRSV